MAALTAMASVARRNTPAAGERRLRTAPLTSRSMTPPPVAGTLVGRLASVDPLSASRTRAVDGPAAATPPGSRTTRYQTRTEDSHTAPRPAFVHSGQPQRRCHRPALVVSPAWRAVSWP